MVRFLHAYIIIIFSRKEVLYIDFKYSITSTDFNCKTSKYFYES